MRTGAKNPESTSPLGLNGRDNLIETAHIAIERTRRRLSAQSLLLLGARGVGKTVLLDHIREKAESAGIRALRIDASERRSLPALLIPQFRQALFRLSNQEEARGLAQRGLKALAGFAKTLKAKYADIEVGLDLDPEPGLADNGDLEHDLKELVDAAGAAAEAADTALVLFIDDLHHVEASELAALIAALHRAAQKRRRDPDWRRLVAAAPSGRACQTLCRTHVRLLGNWSVVAFCSYSYLIQI